MQKFSHIDSSGRAEMVDVGKKIPQRRTALATGEISLSAQTVALIKENQIKKGDVLTVSQIAGIQAAKQTPLLIPLCHPLELSKVDVELQLTESAVAVQSGAQCIGRTGVEMEALTAVSVALLTVYDMCKAVDKNMQIGQIKLIEKVKENVG